jgi:hypothetical protein
MSPRPCPLRGPRCSAPCGNPREAPEQASLLRGLARIAWVGPGLGQPWEDTPDPIGSSSSMALAHWTCAALASSPAAPGRTCRSPCRSGAPERDTTPRREWRESRSLQSGWVHHPDPSPGPSRRRALEAGASSLAPASSVRRRAGRSTAARAAGRARAEWVGAQGWDTLCALCASARSAVISFSRSHRHAGFHPQHGPSFFQAGATDAPRAIPPLPWRWTAAAPATPATRSGSNCRN